MSPGGHGPRTGNTTGKTAGPSTANGMGKPHSANAQLAAGKNVRKDAVNVYHAPGCEYPMIKPTGDVTNPRKQPIKVSYEEGHYPGRS
jgi:hypothetical protein